MCTVPLGKSPETLGARISFSPTAPAEGLQGWKLLDGS